MYTIGSNKDDNKVIWCVYYLRLFDLHFYLRTTKNNSLTFIFKYPSFDV